MMRTACFVLAVSVWLPATAYAKRGAPAPVKPVIEAGVRYEAPNKEGRRALVQAWDTASGKMLWETVVFTTPIRPDLEEDVQWVFIKELDWHSGNLRVTAENGKRYALNVTTREVRELE